MALSTQNQSESLWDVAAAVQWPDVTLAGQFISDCDHMWGTEAGRVEVRRWVALLGKFSPFVEGAMWTAPALRKHCAAYDAYIAAEEAEKAAKEAPVKAGKHTRTKEQRERSKMWHDAVDARREAIAASKKLVDAQRARHQSLIEDWDAYVEAVKAGHVTPGNIAAGS